jgi:hypothetical protein
MYESHDDTGVTGTTKLTEDRTPRAPWQRPSFRIMPARDAEIGVAVTVSDGAFTTS